MKYFPDLIPEEHRVLRDYFKEETQRTENSNDFFRIGSIILGIILMVCAIIPVRTYFPFTIILITTGMLLFPKVNQAIAQQFKLRLTTKVRLVLGLVLLSINVLYGGRFIQIRSELIQKANIEFQLAEKARLNAEKREMIRQDSLTSHLNKTDSFALIHQPEMALLELRYAEKYLKTEADKGIIIEKRSQLLWDKVNTFYKSKMYNEAVAILNQLSEGDEQNAEILYQRALCYSKLNNIKFAVKDCLLAMDKGHFQAKQLYEKINPIRKRIIGYETLCNDGTTSDARGRGACSHHGGVANWNYPIYEEYRKY